jgi:SAM-dependent methyltransferase
VRLFGRSMLVRRLKWLAWMFWNWEFEVLVVDFSSRVYRAFWGLVYLINLKSEPHASPPKTDLKLVTQHPIAYESPDHLIPWGTMNDNSSNKRFVLLMDERLRKEDLPGPKGFMDLGCSGGQLVKDFMELGWIAVGVEGSDYSLRHGRANWPALGNRNLFTCDITQPFQVTNEGANVQFDLITAWEVLEHIPTPGLVQLFANISKHLKKGGYFVASTTSAPDIHDGVDLHQTKWSNLEWREWIRAKFPEFEFLDLQYRLFDYVRFNYQEPSFLVARKK